MGQIDGRYRHPNNTYCQSRCGKGHGDIHVWLRDSGDEWLFVNLHRNSYPWTAYWKLFGIQRGLVIREPNELELKEGEFLKEDKEGE